MPGVCYEAVLLLETSGRSAKLVDEYTARKYTWYVVGKHCDPSLQKL